MADITIKDVPSVAVLETLVGTDIGDRVISLREKAYKGDDYYRKRSYCVRGTFENGGYWYAGVMIYKGKLLGIRYPNPVKWQEEWNK
jgi:hypothetical protein